MSDSNIHNPTNKESEIDAYTNECSRRQFLKKAGQGFLAVSLSADLLSHAVAQTEPPPASSSQPIQFPPIVAPTEQQRGPLPAPLPPGERVGFAIVGLGRLSLEELLPAFGESKKARLAALVSGDANKARRVAQQYGVPEQSLYDYHTYDRLRDNPDVQVIYIVLPNSMHHEFTIRGARAGKHILCEKPMAVSAREAEEMIAVCERANLKLMIAYRIQYEPYNRMVRDMVRTKRCGTIKFVDLVNAHRQGDPNHWRLKRELSGGGSLPDIGIYCLNTVRFLTGEEPADVSASIVTPSNDPRFREVEDAVSFRLRFPSGIIAGNFTSYDAHRASRYRVYATEGWFGLDPAFSYRGLQMETAQADGKVERIEHPRIREKNQFAAEMDHMAECVLENKRPYTPGEEGLQDHRIMAAIYESARTGRPITLDTPTKLDAFRGTEPNV
ncbi:MAG TPA: Gfo/Idh/MocA family oxidoreductase [Nitrospiraceae bacterium]|nr:Gfo/Idh/MocA family oxidoreductase [Nitrospiraceae bacterium]